MKYLKQFAIILAVSLLGEALQQLLPLPVPASIYGLALMFLALRLKLLPLAAVEQTADFLVEIMPVMFIPAAVGLLESWPALRTMLLPALAAVIVVTPCVMGATGRAAQAVLRAERRNRKEASS